MSELRPALLSILGGILVAAGGLLLWHNGTPLAAVLALPRAWYLGGVAVGSTTVVAGALMRLMPRARRVAGVAVLVCAAMSLPLAFGGFVGGFLLSAVGGAIAAAPGSRAVAGAVPVGPFGRPPPWT